MSEGQEKISICEYCGSEDFGGNLSHEKGCPKDSVTNPESLQMWHKGKTDALAGKKAQSDHLSYMIGWEMGSKENA